MDPWRNVIHRLAVIVLVLGILGTLSACEAAGSVSATELPSATAVIAGETAGSDRAGSPSGETTLAASPDPYLNLRQQMVDTQIRDRGVSDGAVLAVMAEVPRHEFVPADYQSQAYEDHPLPIGHGQTISQPYIVAVMTELVDLQPGERVLEIGTGSGYQAAILAEITEAVYTIEIIPELAGRAAQTFERLGYSRITVKQADGYDGWEEHAPFDAILVTAAPDHVPQSLVQQLADGGKMIIPIGPPGGYQSLWLIERQGDRFLRHNWGGVRFVPFTRSTD